MEKNVQVGSKGVNRKAQAFEEHGNFLELDETHSWEEGDPQGPILMDEPWNASVEEVTNNFVKKQLVLDAPSFGIKELKASKQRRRVVKPMAEWVSTAKTTMQALKAIQGIKKGLDKV